MRTRTPDLMTALSFLASIVGLTVVSCGTSAPELAVSMKAALAGTTERAFGNVVGSNVLNLTIVLGLTTIVAPGGVTVPADALRFDTPVMIGAAFLCVPVFPGRFGPGAAGAPSEDPGTPRERRARAMQSRSRTETRRAEDRRLRP